MKKVYDEYHSSVGLLKAGFNATKLNFSNMRRKKVTAWLSNDERYLMYKPIERTGFFDSLKPVGKIALSSIQNFIYGGVTSTFKKHQVENLELMKEKDREKQTYSDRKISSQYTILVRTELDRVIPTETLSPASRLKKKFTI